MTAPFPRPCALGVILTMVLAVVVISPEQGTPLALGALGGIYAKEVLGYWRKLSKWWRVRRKLRERTARRDARSKS